MGATGTCGISARQCDWPGLIDNGHGCSPAQQGVHMLSTSSQKWTGRVVVPPKPSPGDRVVVSWPTPSPGTQVVRAQNKAGAARRARMTMFLGSTWPRDDVDASRSVPSPQVLQHGHTANRCLQAPVERVVLDPLASATGPDICVDFKPPKAALWQPWGRCGASQSWDAAEPHQAEKVGWRGHRVS